MSSSPYPPHGTRSRVRNLNCNCVACARRTGPVGADYEVRWPFLPMQRFFGSEMLEAWFDEEQIKQWRADGLSDAEADHVSVMLGVLPYQVWGGYIEAGLDYKEVSRASV